MSELLLVEDGMLDSVLVDNSKNLEGLIYHGLGISVNYRLTAVTSSGCIVGGG
jgi:hypothetical protein